MTTESPARAAPASGLRSRAARRGPALALAAALLFLPGLGNVQLRDWDEGTFASVAREMTETGEWLRPTLFGEPYLNKPPLLFWLMAASFQIGGISETSARLPGALLTAGGVLLLWLAARRLFASESPAVLSAVVYLTLLPVVRHGRLAMIDGMVNTFVVAAIYCVLRGGVSGPWLAGVGISLGLVAMAKGLLVLAVAAAIGAWMLWMTSGRLLRSPWLWLGLAVGFAPVFAWYGLQIASYGGTFVDVHVFSQGLARIVGPIEGHGRPPWFYLLELLKTAMPWLLFAIPALAWAARSRQEAWARLVLTAGGGFLLIISAMPTKLPWYLMPCHVSLALAAGWYLARSWEREGVGSRMPAAALLLCAVAASAALIYQVRTGRTPPPVASAAVAIASCAGAGVLAARRSRYVAPALAGGLYLALVSLVATPLWNWEVNEAFDVRPVATLVKAHAPPGAEVRTTFPYRRPSLDFYAGRRILPVAGGDAPPGAYILVDETPGRLSADAPVLGRAGGFALIPPLGVETRAGGLDARLLAGGRLGFQAHRGKGGPA